MERARKPFTSEPDPSRGQRGPYDLVWYFQVRAWVLAGGPSSTPAVVDIDDLEDQKILARAALPETRRRPWRATAPACRPRMDHRRRPALATPSSAHRRPCGGHRCLQRARRAGEVGLPGVRVIPNGYPPPPTPVGRDTVSCPPVVIFQGTLRYPPNADAARFLVEDVGPRACALSFPACRSAWSVSSPRRWPPWPIPRLSRWSVRYPTWARSWPRPTSL